MFVAIRIATKIDNINIETFGHIFLFFGKVEG